MVYNASSNLFELLQIAPKARKIFEKNESVNYYTCQLLHLSMCQFLHIKMPIFTHIPSIIAHLYAKKAVSLHIEIKNQPLSTCITYEVVNVYESLFRIISTRF